MFYWYPYCEPFLAPAQLVMFMLGMGATLAWEDFTRILQKPLSLSVGLAVQLLIIPLVAVAINHLAGLPPGIALGLLLVAAMPGGSLSKVFVYLARGNVALSTTLSACATLACLVTVPLVLGLLASEYVPADFEMPVGWVVSDVFLFLLLPMLVGMQVRRFAPAGVKVFSRWCLRLGFVLVAVMIVGSLGSGKINPSDYGLTTPLAIIIFCVLAQQLAMLLFRLRGWSSPDTAAVGIESTMRNMNLALLLKARLFPDQPGTIDPLGAGVLFVILYYAATALIAGTPLALRMRRVIGREQRRANRNG